MKVFTRIHERKKYFLGVVLQHHSHPFRPLGCWLYLIPSRDLRLTYLRLERVQHGGGRPSAVDQDQTETPTRMCQTESSQNVRSSALSQTNYVFDVQEVQHGHHVLAKHLQTGKHEAATTDTDMHTK